MTMTNAELMKALIQKFIQVTLDDGSVNAGLINGLMRDSIEVARVVDVEFPKREDTTQIPIVGFEDK